jgi:hypothetical protein
VRFVIAGSSKSWNVVDMRLAFALPLLVAALVPALPASAAEERILTIFGGDKCPDNTICVRAPEGDRYRIPKALREPSKSPDSVSWAQRSQGTLSEGRSGAESCSAVGSAGWTGCWAEQMRKARAEAKALKDAAPDVP